MVVWPKLGRIEPEEATYTVQRIYMCEAEDGEGGSVVVEMRFKSRMVLNGEIG